MRPYLSCIFLFLVLATAAPLSWAAELRAVHTDQEWNEGKGNVPQKGICSRHGGDNLTPGLAVSGIPKNARLLRLLFTDDNYGSEGGHGEFILKLDGESEIQIPSFKDGSLPPNMSGGNGHHCSFCPETDYLGPCSGGRWHTYRVNIYALDSEGKVVSKTTTLLGIF